MDYRGKLKKMTLSQNEEPSEDYVLISDVEDLLNLIESDFNSLKDRILKDLIDTKDDIERRLEIMSSELY